MLRMVRNGLHGRLVAKKKIPPMWKQSQAPGWFPWQDLMALGVKLNVLFEFFAYVSE